MDDEPLFDCTKTQTFIQSEVKELGGDPETGELEQNLEKKNSHNGPSGV